MEIAREIAWRGSEIRKLRHRLDPNVSLVAVIDSILEVVLERIG